ncbi:unnamed protein product [Protopolystoma xenopodis]|uniref:Uncharacterized protein n=1 Tax=Protopolystoma xenopodis TaxID=117903 RepID=A0A3S5B3L7_9PLAT|nr:unnamed protein product [Protopolystoma xenopodis]
MEIIYKIFFVYIAKDCTSPSLKSNDNLSSSQSDCLPESSSHLHSPSFTAGTLISPPGPQLSEEQRRLHRLASLPRLIEVERVLILEASAALQECQNRDKNSAAGAIHSNKWGAGESLLLMHIENSKKMLIACKPYIVLLSLRICNSLYLRHTHLL